MRKIITIIFGLCLLSCTSAQVKWHTVNEASDASIGSKLYFIDFYTDWCGYCKKMDRNTFSDPTVAKILNQFYYPTKFNAESSATVKWKGQTYKGTTGSRSNVHQFATATLGQQMGFPTFAIYKSDGTLLTTIPGYYDAKNFIVILWFFASGDYEKYPYERYTRIFDTDIKPNMLKQLK